MDDKLPWTAADIFVCECDVQIALLDGETERRKWVPFESLALSPCNHNRRVLLQPVVQWLCSQATGCSVFLWTTTTVKLRECVNQLQLAAEVSFHIL